MVAPPTTSKARSTPLTDVATSCVGVVDVLVGAEVEHEVAVGRAADPDHAGAGRPASPAEPPGVRRRPAAPPISTVWPLFQLADVEQRLPGREPGDGQGGARLVRQALGLVGDGLGRRRGELGVGAAGRAAEHLVACARTPRRWRPRPRPETSMPSTLGRVCSRYPRRFFQSTGLTEAAETRIRTSPAAGLGPVGLLVGQDVRVPVSWMTTACMTAPDGRGGGCVRKHYLTFGKRERLSRPSCAARSGDAASASCRRGRRRTPCGTRPCRGCRRGTRRRAASSSARTAATSSTCSATGLRAARCSMPICVGVHTLRVRLPVSNSGSGGRACTRSGGRPKDLAVELGRRLDVAAWADRRSRRR